MLPRNVLVDKFTIKKMVDTTTLGRLTKTLSTVSTGNRGKFVRETGEQMIDGFGRVERVDETLYCDYSASMLAGRVVEDEGRAEEFDVLTVATRSTPIGHHHMEVKLRRRERDVA